MPVKAFVDSNVLLYAAVQDTGEPRCAAALSFIQSCSDSLTISVQVVNEFCSVLLRKGVADARIQRLLEGILTDVHCADLTTDTVLLCWRLRGRYAYSYYDSLILASAVENGCTKLYSEDFQHGQVIQRSLRIINPFAP